MTPTRLLLILSALLSVLLVAGPARAGDSGGVPAQSVTQDSGGGVVAPLPTDAVGAEAEAAQQDTTPTTPGGEEQPPDGGTGTDETSTEEGGGTGPGTGPGGGTGAGAESAGGLPRTGLELAALSMIGLGLLMAGLALRPTSSWPPPRDRLSRSMPRR
jgi:hypothetical protein